jgi:hypothetical protein
MAAALWALVVLGFIHIVMRPLFNASHRIYMDRHRYDFRDTLYGKTFAKITRRD